MPTDLPLVCSLSASELPDRLAEMGAIGDAALLGVERLGNRAKLRFRPGEEIHKRLTAVVAAESKCCAFLDMSLRNDERSIELVIDAPEGAEPVLDDLVAAFELSNSATSAETRR